MLRCVLFFKQKTTYEMRISDWSSDACSSNLDLVIIVEKADDRETRGDEQARPDEAVREVHPQQRRDHQRNQDHQPAHRRRALFGEVALRAVDRKSTRLNSSH